MGFDDSRINIGISQFLGRGGGKGGGRSGSISSSVSGSGRIGGKSSGGTRIWPRFMGGSSGAGGNGAEADDGMC